MILPSVASCDFARTHPAFLASLRPPKNLKKETLQKEIDFIYKVTYKRAIFDPRRPRTSLDLYFLSEIHSLDVSHSRRTNLDFFIAFADVLPLHYLIIILFSFFKIPCETSRIFGGPISISIAFAHALFQLYLVLFTYCRFVSLCTRNSGFLS